MPADRFLLVASAVLQGVVSLTFGLVFLGMWKGFGRRTALRWTIAWLLYGLGVLNTASGIALGIGAAWPPTVQGLVALPLLVGALSFRAGTDALADVGPAPRLSGPVAVIIAVSAGVILVRVAGAAGWISVGPNVIPYTLPRLVMGIGYLWVAWPLVRVPASRWRKGFGLLVAALAALALRMFLAAGYEIYQVTQGAAPSPENQVLTIVQLSLLIVFGVATTVVLIDAERVDAQRAADTIQRAEQALRDAQERMRFALEASHVGVWEADLRTGVTYWSDTCEVLHGLAPGTFGRTFDAYVDRMHPEDQEAARHAIDQATREHRDAELEYRTIWPDGTERRMTATAHFFYNDDGVPVRGAGVALDVTERRSLEDQFRQAQKMEAVGQLAGGIAHDFNNLLTVILGNAELVLANLPGDDQRWADVQEIKQAAERAGALTHQLLAFSRKQILTPRVLDLGNVVSDVTPMLRRLLGETIDLHAAIANRGYVKADVGQMEQVLVNLAVNARDAMPDGGRLTIETGDVFLDDAYATRHPTVRPGPHVMIAVSDTGSGITAATQKRVFEPFFTTKPVGQGTGLGLATVSGVVEQSGGSISVYSEVGRGTTFKIYLPRTDDVEKGQAAARVDARTLRGDETILLVEDEQVVRDFMNRVLGQYGYDVHAIADPSRAIEFADQYHGAIQLILTDVVLPEMSGPAMVTELQQRHPEARVLFISGYADQAIVRHGILDPGLSFLQKPFTGGALARFVRDVLDASGA
jgi:PAS domain S-box-containing protein